MLRKNIIHIIGARLQFIKLAILLKKIKKKLDVKNLIIYIRQQRDYEMPKFFFKELSIPDLYVNFNLEKLLIQN